MGLLKLLLGAVTLAITLGTSRPAWAAQESGISAGDTGFILICAALVMLMTPGLAMFYGGMVRSKNILSVLMQCLATMALVSIQWILIGYTLSFGPDHHALIGDLTFWGFGNIGGEALSAAVPIPHLAFAGFQLMFAVIAAALITGAFAERMKFSVFVVFILLWTTLIYDPLAHWVWGGGWLSRLGIMDFAGGTVVHISSGVSGLVAAVLLGKRIGNEPRAIRPHNMPLTVLGAGLLWFGWFGFNAGSALSANEIAALAFVVTNTCAAAGALSWVAAEWLHHGKPTVFGAVSGAVAGLVAITPAAGFVSPLAAIAIGLIAGPLCYLAVSRIKEQFAYDDALDVFGIHGVAESWGAVATGILATTAVNPSAIDGLLAGNPAQVLTQSIGVVATYVFAAALTYAILKAISIFTALRVSPAEEEAGLEPSLHGEDGYSVADLSGEGHAAAF
ncbi:MAG: ammonium transporter [Syntrophomonadaceae bacterium]|jgi:Amt family ammonium transporter